MAAGGEHACALISDGTVKCWGWNGAADPLDPTPQDYTRKPVLVRNLPNPITGARPVAISAGEMHTCALMDDGTVECWGSNYSGQLGNGINANSATPVTVIKLTTAVAISAKFNDTCAVLSNGTAQCWGANNYGQVGNGSTIQEGYGGINKPVSVKGLGGVVAITLGANHTCALLSDGRVKCWGENYNAWLLGTATLPNLVLTPTTVVADSSGTPLSGVLAISSNYDKNCALLDDGTVKCWGDGFLGDGVSSLYDQSPTPVQVVGVDGAGTLSGAKAISDQQDHTCALLDNGTVNCWGDDRLGQLGIGNQDFGCCFFSPVAVVADSSGSGIPLSDAVAISAGYSDSLGFTCALLADGTVKCWGTNYWGQLGNGTSTYIAKTPVATKPLVPLLTWTSDNTSVATIGRASGLVTALAPGTATITATYGNLSAGTTLTVTVPVAPATTSITSTTSTATATGRGR